MSDNSELRVVDAIAKMTALEEPKFIVQVFKNRGKERCWFHLDKALIDDSMVVVGGGAVMRWTGNGASLTASCPTKEMNGWIAKGSDQIYPCACEQDVYALGLKIHGMTREELVSNMHVAVATSPVGSNPEVSASLPSDYLMVGGGAHANVSGNCHVLTASFPSLDSWTARSHEHLGADPASVTAYAIGIRRHLPVGTVETHIQRVDSNRESYPSATASVQPGFTLTCGGAEAHWERLGSLLWKLKPTEHGFEGGSKDQNAPDPCILSAFSVAMRIV